VESVQQKIKKKSVILHFGKCTQAADDLAPLHVKAGYELLCHLMTTNMEPGNDPNANDSNLLLMLQGD
jgi:hypothetical protein